MMAAGEKERPAAVGKVHAYQSMGTLDGPGVRFVVFLRGCPLRCAYCHNPDTWEQKGGMEVSAQEVYERIERCRSYFGRRGGVTVSGGEPLMQADFLRELFSLCRKAGIHTALDTSGCLYSPKIDEVLDLCDLVLLDVKATEEEAYRRLCKGSLRDVLRFWDVLEAKKIPTWIRHVVVEGLNDTEEEMAGLRALLQGRKCVERVELLPFRKLCLEKYERLGIAFPLEDFPETSKAVIRRQEELLGFQK